MGKVFTSPLAPLVFFALGVTVCSMMYPLMGVVWSERYLLFFGYAWGLALMSWLTHDARRHRWTPCYDFGQLAGIFGPLSILWYAVWSRRARGLLLPLFFVFLYIASWFPAFAVMVAQQMRP